MVMRWTVNTVADVNHVCPASGQDNTLCLWYVMKTGKLDQPYAISGHRITCGQLAIRYDTYTLTLSGTMHNDRVLWHA